VLAVNAYVTGSGLAATLSVTPAVPAVTLVVTRAVAKM